MTENERLQARLAEVAEERDSYRMAFLEVSSQRDEANGRVTVLERERDLARDALAALIESHGIALPRTAETPTEDLATLAIGLIDGARGGFRGVLDGVERIGWRWTDA